MLEKRWWTVPLAVLLGSAALTFDARGQADLFGWSQTMEASKELDSMGTGGGGPGRAALGAARALGAGQPGVADTGGQTGMAGFWTPTLGSAQTMIKVIAGERVFCHVTGKLLDDAREMNKEESEAKLNYYDDGTHGDELPNDGIYTNITESDEYMSLDADVLRRRVLSAVVQAEARSPMDFFLRHVSTIEPVSIVPNEIKLEEDRDKKIEEWAREFLRLYRVDPEDPRSGFWPAFIPPPPPLPDAPLPKGFDPRQGAAGVGGQGAGVLGSGAGAENMLFMGEEDVEEDEDDGGDEEDEEDGGDGGYYDI